MAGTPFAYCKLQGTGASNVGSDNPVGVAYFQTNFPNVFRQTAPNNGIDICRPGVYKATLNHRSFGKDTHGGTYGSYVRVKIHNGDTFLSHVCESANSHSVGNAIYFATSSSEIFFVNERDPAVAPGTVLVTVSPVVVWDQIEKGTLSVEFLDQPLPQL